MNLAEALYHDKRPHTLGNIWLDYARSIDRQG